MTTPFPAETLTDLQRLWETADLPAEKIAARYGLSKNQLIGLAHRRHWVKFATPSYYVPAGGAVIRLPVEKRAARQNVAERKSAIKRGVVSRGTRRQLKAAGLEAEVVPFPEKPDEPPIIDRVCLSDDSRVVPDPHGVAEVTPAPAALAEIPALETSYSDPAVLALFRGDEPEDEEDDNSDEPWPYERTMMGRLDALHATMDAVLFANPSRRAAAKFTTKQMAWFAKRYG